uniref:Cytosolic fatty-acid binding proteins domain-containing protein n=1 Tax=Plectus sambesii TaxID=2011161 RepID=A0A914X5D2_9BILA
MAEAFVGKWKLVESENFDEYMKAIGVGLMTRKLGASVKPVMDVTVNNGKWSIVSVSTFKTINMDFELDKEFDETTPDGRQMKSTITLTPDGKLVQQQRKVKDGDKDSVLTRYVEGNKLITVCESQGVTCKRIYEKVE